MRWPRAATAALGALAGAVTSTAFPPLSLWWAAPVGVGALVLLVRERSAPSGGWLGGIFGLVMFVPLFHFADVAMGNALGWAALSVVESIYLAVLGAAWALVSRLEILGGPAPSRTRPTRPSSRGRRLGNDPRGGGGTRARREIGGRRGSRGSGGRPASRSLSRRAQAPARVAAFMVLWCGVEELRSSWPWGGFPFGRLAFAMADSPMLPFAGYGGSIGLTALVVLIAGCLAELVVALRGVRPLAALGALIVAGALVLAPLALPGDSRSEDGTLRVGAVQGNVAEDFEDAFGRALEVTGNHAEATEALAQDVGAGNLDVVIWPENAADLDPRTNAQSAALVERAAEAVGAPVLVGAVAYADDVRFNDIVVWTPGQGAGASYRKHRPVPFAEYVPWRSALRRITTQVDRIGTDMVAGTGPQTLTVQAATQGRGVTLAMGICFEVAYDSTLRAGVEQGGELIVVPTNNASFLHSTEARQQLDQGRVQAVVHGRAVVQVSTVGITAIISPRGVVEQQTEPYTRASLVADVPLRTSLTVADRLGPWPGALLELGALALVTTGSVGAVVRRRSRAPRRRRR